MEVTVDGRSYQLWKDCAYCFLRGFDNDCITPCEHTSKVTNYLETVPVKETGGTMQSYFEPSSMYGSPRQSSVRGSWNDSKVTIFPDSDSGFSSLKTRLVGDEMALTPRSSGTLVRANSMNRLNGSYNSQDLTPFNVSHSMNMHPVLERSLRTLKDSLEDSENRRVVLMHKLKEAQDTLSLQGERLAKIENSAKGNSILVEDLKLKEQDYRRKINALEKSEEDIEMLRMENLRLREEMQDRISKLDFQLRSLQAQHEVAEHENQKRIGLLDQSTTALTMLEADNNKLKADNDTYRQELAVVKESLNLTKERYEPVEMENKSLRAEVYRLREENSDLNKKLAELTGQLSELRKLTQSMKDENEKLASAWKTLAEEKQSSARQLESAQDKASEMKAKASTASAEKDRLFQEKMDLNNKFQQLIVNKEQIERANQVLQEQLEEYQNEAQRAKNSSRKREEERDIMEDELHEAKRLNQELEDELQTVKSYYEKACEQISVLENTKKTANQQQEWTIQENERLKGEVDRLSKDGDEEDWVSDNRSKEMRRERDELEHTIQGMKNELRDLRHENSQLGNKNQELETKLRKANADLRSEAEVQREELQTWKDTSERLTASVHKQEAEIRDLMDRCDELEEYNAKMKSDNRTLQDECEELRDHKEDVDRLKKENKKLLQENAENEQMIKLLETQKEVLTKNVYKNYLESTTSVVSDAYPESDNEIESESQLAKLHDIDVLGAKVEQFRDENATLRERILELEKVRDNLQIERDELQTCKELIYNKPKMEELDRQVDELRETNRQLREMNESIAKKVDVIEQEMIPSQRASHTLSSYSENAPLNRNSVSLEPQLSLHKSQISSFSSGYLYASVGTEKIDENGLTQQYNSTQKVGQLGQNSESTKTGVMGSDNSLIGSGGGLTPVLDDHEKDQLKSGSLIEDNEPLSFNTLAKFPPNSSSNKILSTHLSEKDSQVDLSANKEDFRSGQKRDEKLNIETKGVPWGRSRRSKSLSSVSIKPLDKVQFHSSLGPLIEFGDLLQPEDCDGSLDNNLNSRRVSISMSAEKALEAIVEGITKGTAMTPKQMNFLQQIPTIVKENLEMREAIGGDGSLVPRGDFERLEEDKQQLQDELDQVKKDLNNMKQKHQQYVQEFGPDGESSYQSNERIRKLEKEKQGLEKQVALINGQLLLVEGSKKRLDEVVEDLQHEIVHLRRELEEAEKQIASLQAEEKTGPVGTAEMQQLQEEIENLREALASSQKDKMKQDKLVRSLKEELDDEKCRSNSGIRESLDDVGSDLTEMRGELNKLMGVIQDKDHEIENLEDQLRQSKSASKDRSGQDQDQMRKSRSPTRASRIPRKTEDEAVRRPITKENGFHSPTKSLGEYKSGSKSGASESLRLSDPEPRSKSSGDKGSDRLQSLISKYRSHSESPFPERKIKPLSLSKEGNKMGLVTRGKSFGPAAPKDGKVSDSQTGDKHSKDLAESEHKSPIEKSQTESERKDIHNVNIGFQSKEEEDLNQESQASVFSIPPALDQSKPLDIESPLLSKLQSPLLSPPSDFNAQLSPKLFESEANGVPRRGRRASAGDVDEFPDIDAPIDPEGLDSREQDDIDALIRNCYRSHLLFLVTLRRQRAASGHTSPGGKISSPQQKPLLSVNPPKLTSKIIADLLNTRPQYRSSPPLSLSLPTSIHRLSESHIKILEKELKT